VDRDRHAGIADRSRIRVALPVGVPGVVAGVATRIGNARDAPTQRATARHREDRDVDGLDAVLLPHRPRVRSGVEHDLAATLALGAMRAAETRIGHELLSIEEIDVGGIPGRGGLADTDALDGREAAQRPTDADKAVRAGRAVRQSELGLEAAK